MSIRIRFALILAQERCSARLLLVARKMPDLDDYFHYIILSVEAPGVGEGCQWMSGKLQCGYVSLRCHHAW
jgi:oligoribonuclease (3'-5' exoribonuclease)